MIESLGQLHALILSKSNTQRCKLGQVLDLSGDMKRIREVAVSLTQGFESERKYVRNEVRSKSFAEVDEYANCIKSFVLSLQRWMFMVKLVIALILTTAPTVAYAFASRPQHRVVWPWIKGRFSVLVMIKRQ